MAEEIFEIDFIDDGEGAMDDVTAGMSPEERSAYNAEKKAAQEDIIDVDEEDSGEEDGEDDIDPLTGEKIDQGKTGTGKQPSKEKDSGEDNSTEIISPFAATLKESSILPDLDIDEFNKLETTDEQLAFLLESMETRVKSAEYADLNDQQKELLDLFREGSQTDVQKYLANHQAQVTAQTKFATINEDNAEEFIRTYYKMKGQEDEAELLLDELAVNGKQLEMANKLKPKYDKFLEDSKKAIADKAKLEAKAQADAQAENLNKLKSTINGTDEIIAGAKLSAAGKQELISMITKPQARDKNGRVVTEFQKVYQEDPYHTEMVLNYLLKITDGFKDMSKISYTSSTKTKAIQELKNKLDQEAQRGSAGKGTPRGAGTNNNDNDDFSSWDSVNVDRIGI